LAKNVIQVSVLSRSNRELQNRSLTRRKFAEFLGSQRRSLVAFEACATAHYWARVAQRHGHEVKIIPAKAVTPYVTPNQRHSGQERSLLRQREAVYEAAKQRQPERRLGRSSNWKPVAEVWLNPPKEHQADKRQDLKAA